VREVAALLVLELVAFSLLACVGVGLSAWLLDSDDRAKLAFAPALGLATLACLLLSAQWLAPSAPLARLLLPLAVAFSLAASVIAWRRDRLSRAQLAELPWAAVAATGPLLLAAWPYVIARTAGPINLQFMDAWFYVPIDRWFQDHSLRDSVPVDFTLPTLSVVQEMQDLQIRVGFDVFNSSLASLTGAGPDLTLAAAANVIFAVTPVSVYAIARGIGGQSRPVSLGAAFLAGSPALITLPFDSAGPNASGVALVTVMLWLGALSLAAGPLRPLIALGILGGGIISLYSEFLPLVVLAFAALILLNAYRAARASEGSRLCALAPLAARSLLVAGVAAAVSPVATVRTARYLDHLNGLDFARSFDRGLTVATAPGWLFGVIHLYEVPRVDLFSTLKLGVAIGLPVLLLLVAGAGVFHAPRVLRDWAIAGTVGCLALAAWAEWRLEWNYGAHRTLTALVPVAAVAVALGLAYLWTSGVGPGRLGQGVTLVLGGCLVVLVLRSLTSLVDAQAHARTDFQAGTRHVPTLLRKAGAGEGPVLVEGADAGYPGDPYFDIPAVIDQVGASGARPVFDPSMNAVIVGGGFVFRRPDPSYAPDYSHVVTRFGGIRSQRVSIGEAGPYEVMQRARVDVALVGTGWAVAEDTPGRKAFPWLREEFELWISSPKAMRAALRLRFVGSEVATAALQVADGEAVRVRMFTQRLRGRLDACIDVQLHRGRTELALTPVFATPLPLVGGIPPDQAPPAVDRRLGLVALFAEAGSRTRCAGA
jgi:hypothetical protein